METINPGPDIPQRPYDRFLLARNAFDSEAHEYQRAMRLFAIELNERAGDEVSLTGIPAGSVDVVKRESGKPVLDEILPIDGTRPIFYAGAKVEDVRIIDEEHPVESFSLILSFISELPDRMDIVPIQTIHNFMWNRMPRSRGNDLPTMELPKLHGPR